MSKTDYTEEDTFLALTRMPYSKLRESAAIKLLEFDCEAVYYHGDHFHIGTFDRTSGDNAVAGTGWTTDSVQTYIKAGLSIQNAIIRRYSFIKRMSYISLILIGMASIVYFVGASASVMLIMSMAQCSILVMVILNLVYDNLLRQPSIRDWRDNHPSSIKRKKTNAFFRRK